MKVAELIEVLKQVPQDLDVVYVNRCADEGAEIIDISEVEVKAGPRYGFGSCDYPGNGVVVLE